MKHLESALGAGNQIWKYIIVLIVTFVIASLVGSIPLVAVYTIKAAQSGIAYTSFDVTDLQSVGISTNLGLVLLMLPLVLGLGILVLLVGLFHKRSYQEIINGTDKVRWSRFLAGAGVWAVLMVLMYVVEYIIDPSNFVLQFDLSAFIPLIFISLLMIPLQTAFEELAFRGYLAQGIGALTKNRWIVLIIPSVLFGLLHYDNPEVKEFGFLVMMPQYIFFGLVLGLVSLLDDGLEIAMGIHAANNVLLSLFMTHSSSALQTAAVFQIQKIDPYMEFVLSIIAGVILIGFFYKKYNWSFSMMNKKVERIDVDRIKVE